MRSVKQVMVCWCLGVGLSLQLCTPLHAADELPKDAADAKRYTYDYLFMIDALIRNEKYQRARIELDALLERVKQNPDETALTRQAYGYLSIGLKDYPSAIDHFLFAVESGVLPAGVSLNLRYTLAQLMYQEERYKAGLAQLQSWFEQSEKPTPQARVLLASFYYALKKYSKAISALKLAIKQSDSPQESWYQMLVGLYFETRQYKPSVPVLQILVNKYPAKAQYWQQLSDVLLQLGREQQAVAVLSLAASKNLVDESGLIRLAKLYLQLNNPLDAAELISEGIQQGVIRLRKESLTLLVDAWLLAREPEHGIKVLKQLAEIDTSGKPLLRMGRLLMEQERWQEAQQHLAQGIKLARKPAFEDWLLLGSTHYRLADSTAALSAFQSALKLADKPQQTELAQRWIDYLATP
ncbi:MAG: tetratricopeptide repeat protein [Candidatus Thiodiazotropha lotti]|uniref:Tetratricopeptide repeat protein n=1 Tax=Candidatus Thiodiazotropha lotti TaxID=2792787 RepID=A0A9E4N088_9GAMM|nr:tetratricopeptide repeat protein [Candidatus Thiodiazotropha lotti]MCG7938570.1 tetratricopeptide repeat protein [Candidatus Thiodiazotropha lotti]MCG7987924.1 tetratricopeptide repeat protein [Candidatus Thiodiazotropha lotti]MCG8012843.1 tetratricopeptide repeat protein [Candidatus Thiodiazotropha lotti]MCW4203042.1 tetratricopeptide repeat protein [Candidatus Thiodiazotropha lotti]